MSTADDLNVTEAVVPLSDTVKLLGVILDSGLTMDWYVTGVLPHARMHCVTSALC